jgi:hypothetical protein
LVGVRIPLPWMLPSAPTPIYSTTTTTTTTTTSTTVR